MKKIITTIGSMAALITPVVAVVSCGNDKDTSSNQAITQPKVFVESQKQKNEKKLQEVVHYFDNLTLDEVKEKPSAIAGKNIDEKNFLSEIYKLDTAKLSDKLKDVSFSNIAFESDDKTGVLTIKFIIEYKGETKKYSHKLINFLNEDGWKFWSIVRHNFLHVNTTKTHLNFQTTQRLPKNISNESDFLTTYNTWWGIPDLENLDEFKNMKLIKIKNIPAIQKQNSYVYNFDNHLLYDLDFAQDLTWRDLNALKTYGTIDPNDPDAKNYIMIMEATFDNDGVTGIIHIYIYGFSQRN